MRSFEIDTGRDENNTEPTLLSKSALLDSVMVFVTDLFRLGLGYLQYTGPKPSVIRSLERCQSRHIVFSLHPTPGGYGAGWRVILGRVARPAGLRIITGPPTTQNKGMMRV